MRIVVTTAPDVRVFNLSFDNGPLNLLEPARSQQSLILVQDLDNFIFTNDVIVVVSAGNVTPGIIPEAPYPQHHRDPQWALGPWARSFNSLTCGAFVARAQTDGIARHEGWPSPFCRVSVRACVILSSRILLRREGTVVPIIAFTPASEFGERTQAAYGRTESERRLLRPFWRVKPPLLSKHYRERARQGHAPLVSP